jgi:cation diffusion facilitator CzcD-associated flavoprotein CzcO
VLRVSSRKHQVAKGGSPSHFSEVVIVGAGPYGLSLAAHLRARGCDFRIFGSPMEVWRKHMPKGMLLKSEGFASSLCDPDDTFTLEAYCRERDIPYGNVGVPVSLETFVGYGLAFQRQFVPALDERKVTEIARVAGAFELRLADGEIVGAKRVIIAVGVSHYAYIPPVLSELPADFVSHSASIHELDHFKGRRVAVVGAGASAADTAALLHLAGAQAFLVARASQLAFLSRAATTPRMPWQRLRSPYSSLGSSWKGKLLADFPVLFRRLPERLRLKIVRTYLGPAPGWFTEDQIAGKVATILGVRLEGAQVHAEGIRLCLSRSDGSKQMLDVDHVIAGTGYRVDVDRLTFLAPRLRAEICTSHSAPVLSRNFEASVPGLFFVGLSAANTFGPLLRFADGAKFVARRLSRFLTELSV